MERDHACEPSEPYVPRTITGFDQDDAGEWVATLSCAHRRHVRHRPPLEPRPWLLTARGRARRVGTGIECRLCGRGEVPSGLRLARSLGPFDAASLPPGLRRAHRLPEGTWGLLRMDAGCATVVLRTVPPHAWPLPGGAELGLPPGVTHEVVGNGPFHLTIDVLTTSA
jgi:hypothetical protein